MFQLENAWNHQVSYFFKRLHVLVRGKAFSVFEEYDNHSKQNKNHVRRRKARTVFSEHQLNGLEKRFETQKYLSTPDRIELADSLDLSETQVS
jgi:hypothetical protein